MSKEYSNKEITIVWKPELCIHSTKCWKGEGGLRAVFDPASKPWIKPDAAPTEEIIKRVENCPSGALSFYYNEGHAISQEEIVSQELIVEPVRRGPLMVYGNILVKNADGTEVRKSKVTAFCRCGASGSKPFCDGSHLKVGFEG